MCAIGQLWRCHYHLGVSDNRYDGVGQQCRAADRVACARGMVNYHGLSTVVGRWLLLVWLPSAAQVQARHFSG